MDYITPANILCISGHDPSGGAGIQADIEAISHHHAFALSLISCQTVQDSAQVYQLIPQPAELLAQQLQKIIQDSKISAIKTGLLVSCEMIKTIATAIEPLQGIPLIVDPILAAGGSGKTLCKPAQIDCLKQYLLPKTTIITPNTHELHILGNHKDPQQAVKNLFSYGVKNILLTGTHNLQSEAVINTLYTPDKQKSWHWTRLPHSYHGSGCTLASSLATFLAQGFDMESACFKAQDYTWNTLKKAFKSGKGQWTPNRHY